MKDEPYERIYNSTDNCELEFISEGPRGRIVKRIEFRPMEINNCFELVFGNKMEDGNINIYDVSNNGDKSKILRTIAEGICDFLAMHPERGVYFRGSTPARTRLYRIAINLHFKDLVTDHYIFALLDGRITRYQKNMKADAFFVTKRN